MYTNLLFFTLQENIALFSVAVSIITIIGAGISSYVGVRVALAKIDRDITNQKERIEDNSNKITRLENLFLRIK